VKATIPIPSDLEARIKEALHRVVDPCSIAARAPVSLIDMGLVVDWSLDEGANLRVRMCVTSACCTMAPHMVRVAELELSKIPELSSVQVEVDGTVFWTPEMITSRGQAVLNARREMSMAATGVRPQQWRESRPAVGRPVQSVP
jgi:metal-sulfur cluster biosynthetic enzyme